MYVHVCALNIHIRFMRMTVCTHVCVLACGGQRLISGIFLALKLVLLRQSLTELRACSLVRLTSQWVPEVLLSLSSTPAPGSKSHASVVGFLKIWVIGIWTQVLLLPSQALYQGAIFPVRRTLQPMCLIFFNIQCIMHFVSSPSVRYKIRLD